LTGTNETESDYDQVQLEIQKSKPLMKSTKIHKKTKSDATKTWLTGSLHHTAGKQRGSIPSIASFKRSVKTHLFSHPG